MLGAGAPDAAAATDIALQHHLPASRILELLKWPTDAWNQSWQQESDAGATVTATQAQLENAC